MVVFYSMCVSTGDGLHDFDTGIQELVNASRIGANRTLENGGLIWNRISP
jgi:hypothetical protein